VPRPAAIVRVATAKDRPKGELAFAAMIPEAQAAFSRRPGACQLGTRASGTAEGKNAKEISEMLAVRQVRTLRGEVS